MDTKCSEPSELCAKILKEFAQLLDRIYSQVCRTEVTQAGFESVQSGGGKSKLQSKPVVTGRS